IDHERLTGCSSGRRDDIRNRKIGYIFQNYNLIEDETVYENVALVLRMIGFTNPKAIERRVLYVLDRVGIARYKNRPAKMLSGGERQRVGIARAIAKNPSIIIADEPTGNLDSQNTVQIMNIIKSISREKLVILVTHERDVAEFYSDRILRIVDGRVVSDEENHSKGGLDFRTDNTIYLKDLPLQKDLSQGDLHVEFYGDEKFLENEPIPKIKIAVQGGRIFIDTGGALSHGTEDAKLIDGHYQELSQEEVEKYKFHYDEYFRTAEDHEGASKEGIPTSPRYRSIFGPWKAYKNGFHTIRRYSKLKKILLAGFVAASMFVLYAYSSAAGITHITDDRFTTVDKNYLNVKVNSVTPEIYSQYADKEGVEYVIPGDSTVSFTLPVGSYEQNSGQTTTISGSLSSSKKLKESDLICGKLPSSEYEIAVDKMVIQTLLENDPNASAVGLTSPKKYLGRTVTLPYMKPFTIVGVTNKKTPCIYVNPSLLLTAALNGNGETSGNGDNDSAVSSMVPHPSSEGEVLPWNFVSENQDYGFTITKGSAPTGDYQAVIPSSMADQIAIGKTLNTKVNGTNLTVTGYYKDPRGSQGYYVNDSTYEIYKMARMKSITISPEKKSEMYASLRSANVPAVDQYQAARNRYIRSNRTRVRRVLVTAGIILAISLIEIYLMLRASFLSRVKEVGVLRAIGVKKGDIYRMFSGEILAISTVTTLPASIVMYLILRQILKISYMQTLYRITPAVFLLSLATVVIFNLLSGLIPVFRTMRKTPAAILSRTDVN
ncbi:MAG: ATP-binding cassette domain-containing protein, partial [Eubacteriales bacterium]|nr:ATP-binding cassette domain-containing protein [Eubacteriales bacterium]